MYSPIPTPWRKHVTVWITVLQWFSAIPDSLGRGSLGTQGTVFGLSRVAAIVHNHPCKLSVPIRVQTESHRNILTSFEIPWHFNQAITNHTHKGKHVQFTLIWLPHIEMLWIGDYVRLQTVLHFRLNWLLQSNFSDLSGRIVQRRVKKLFWNWKSRPSILVQCEFTGLIGTSRLEPTKQLPSATSTKRTEAHNYSNIPYQKEVLVRKTKATNQRNNYLYSSALGVFANYTPLYEHEYCKHFSACQKQLAPLKHYQSQIRHGPK